MIPPFADSMKVFSTEEVVDVVVIGTGAGAAPVLATLGEAGLSVVALEAGRWWNPAQEYAADEVAMSELYWLQERISAGETPTAFGGNNSGTGVGGSMLHWGAYVPRADPRDLKLRTESGEGVDFPLTYAELVPYYEEVERFLGVAGPAQYPWDQPGQKPRSYPLPPVPWNAPAIAMARGCAALGLQVTAAPIAAVSQNYAQPGYKERQGQHGCDLPAARGRRRSRDSRKQLCAWL
jgi:choline dehydrogenase-like flavoprotein